VHIHARLRMQDAPDVHLGAEQAALRRELLPEQQHQLVSRLLHASMTALITTATGFLGQHLWPVLRAGGDVRCGWVASQSALHGVICFVKASLAEATEIQIREQILDPCLLLGSGLRDYEIKLDGRISAAPESFQFFLSAKQEPGS
jgi:hypothetical protein